MGRRHLWQFRVSTRTARRTVFPQAIERVCNLLARIIRCVTTKFEMAKWQSKRAGNRIIAYPCVRHLVPADRRQTDIWPAYVGQKRAVSAGVPVNKIEKT